MVEGMEGNAVAKILCFFGDKLKREGKSSCVITTDEGRMAFYRDGEQIFSASGVCVYGNNTWDTFNKKLLEKIDAGEFN